MCDGGRLDRCRGIDSTRSGGLSCPQAVVVGEFRQCKQPELHPVGRGLARAETKSEFTAGADSPNPKPFCRFATFPLVGNHPRPTDLFRFSATASWFLFALCSGGHLSPAPTGLCGFSVLCKFSRTASIIRFLAGMEACHYAFEQGCGGVGKVPHRFWSLMSDS